MLTRLVWRPTLLRAAAIVLPAAVLATAIAVVPSFAGSFLTNHKAKLIYLKKGSARHKDPQEERGAPRVPAERTPSPTSPSSALGGEHGAASAPRRRWTESWLPVAACHRDRRPADDPAGPDPLGASDESAPPAPTASVPVAGLRPRRAGQHRERQLRHVSGDEGPEVHTWLKMSIVTAGIQTISAQYSGSDDPSARFKLLNWDLIVHGFPST